MANDDFDFEDQDLDFDDQFDFDEGGETRSSNRAFLLLAGGLFTILVLALGTLGIYQAFFSGGPTESPDGEVAAVDPAFATEAAAIEITNEAILAQNTQVAQTLEARELTAQAPTETPTPIPPTATPTLRPSPTPTATPLVIDSDGETDGEGSDTEGDEVRDVDSDVGEQTDDDAPIEVPSEGEGGEGSLVDGSASEAEAAAPETLPETGIALWGIFAAALGFVGLILISRRLRSDG